jgi:hypothetical protein
MAILAIRNIHMLSHKAQACQRICFGELWLHAFSLAKDKGDTGQKSPLEPPKIELSCAAESSARSEPQQRHPYKKEDHLRRQLQRFVIFPSFPYFAIGPLFLIAKNRFRSFPEADRFLGHAAN